MGVGVTRHVEPVDGHPLAEPRRSEQAVDQPLVGIRPIVGQKRVDLRKSGRQTGEVERHPADQVAPCTPRSRAKAPRPRAGPGRSGRSGSWARPKCLTSGTRTSAGGMNDQWSLPLGPLLDPPLEQIDLLGRERSPQRLRRHPLAFILGRDPGDELALLEVSRHDGTATRLRAPRTPLPSCPAAARPCGSWGRDRGT